MLRNLNRAVAVALCLLMLLAISGIAMAQDEDTAGGNATIRAVWNLDTLILINVSEVGADLSGLTLQSENGEITPENWVMFVDEETTLSYPLTDLRPGDCLQVYLSGGEANPPETVDCTRVVGEFTPTTFDDIVWEVTQGGFSAIVNGSETACDINNTSCTFNVPEGTEMMAEDTVPEAVTVRAAWNTDIFVLVNVSEFGADLGALDLQSELGAITADQWVLFEDEETSEVFTLTDVRPGSCLVSYLGGIDQPELPEGVDCTRIIGEFTPENLDDIIWDVTQNGFTASTGEVCAVEGTTTCDLTVPTAAVEFEMDMMEEDGEEMADANTNARAIWNQDIFVALNLSDGGIDLSGVSFEGEGGAITPDQWVLFENPDGGFYTLDDVRPGSCLVSYLGGIDQPELPAGVDCTRIIGEFTPTNLSDIIWDVNTGGFDISTGATCAVEGTTSCDFTAPAGAE